MNENIRLISRIMHVNINNFGRLFMFKILYLATNISVKIHMDKIDRELDIVSIIIFCELLIRDHGLNIRVNKNNDIISNQAVMICQYSFVSFGKIISDVRDIIVISIY